MKRTILLFTLTAAVAGGYSQGKKIPVASGAAANLCKNNKDSASYSLGVRIAQNLKAQGFDNINLPLMQKAMADVLQNRKPVIVETALNESITKFQKKVNGESAGKAKSEGKIFLANNAKRKGVVVLKSGLQYEVIKAGPEGAPKPTLGNTIKCHYHGTLLNGTVFDSSVDRGQPIDIPVNGVIQGWQEALQLMSVGSKWKLYIPSYLAYGDEPSGPIAPGSTLIFEVELLAINQ